MGHHDSPDELRGWFRGALPGGRTAIGHNGSMDGGSSLVWIRSDGISVVVLLNRNLRDNLWFAGHPLGDALNAAIDAVTSWPGGDLFGSMGIR